MRAYDLWIPSDAVASEVDERAAWALTTMEHSMDAHTTPTSGLRLEDWVKA